VRTKVLQIREAIAVSCSRMDADRRREPSHGVERAASAEVTCATRQVVEDRFGFAV
jgi:hypothetical protein